MWCPAVPPIKTMTCVISHPLKPSIRKSVLEHLKATVLNPTGGRNCQVSSRGDCHFAGAPQYRRECRLTCACDCSMGMRSTGVSLVSREGARKSWYTIYRGCAIWEFSGPQKFDQNTASSAR